MKIRKFGKALWIDPDRDTRIVVKTRWGMKPYFVRRDQLGVLYDPERGYTLDSVSVKIGLPFSEIEFLLHRFSQEPAL